MVVHGLWSVARGFQLMFVIVHCLLALFRTVMWRHASPLRRGDVGARCQLPVV
jgi:hypothetical protein